MTVTVIDKDVVSLQIMTQQGPAGPSTAAAQDAQAAAEAARDVALSFSQDAQSSANAAFNASAMAGASLENANQAAATAAEVLEQTTIARDNAFIARDNAFIARDNTFIAQDFAASSAVTASAAKDVALQAASVVDNIAQTLNANQLPIDLGLVADPFITLKIDLGVV